MDVRNIYLFWCKAHRGSKHILQGPLHLRELLEHHQLVSFFRVYYHDFKSVIFPVEKETFRYKTWLFAFYALWIGQGTSPNEYISITILALHSIQVRTMKINGYK
jgi:hypothetical protein